MKSRFVTIQTLHDPLEAEVLADLLRENGIVTRVLGTQSGSLIGVRQNILALKVEVTESDADAAQSIADSFLEGSGEGALREKGVLDDAPEEPAPGSASLPPRVVPNRLIAAFWVLFLFGGSHLYNRRWFTAAILAATWFVALWATSEHGVVGVAMMAVLLVADLGGGQIVFGRRLTISSGTIAEQLVVGAAIAGVATFVGFRFAGGLWSEHGSLIGRRADLGLVLLTSPTIALGLWLLPRWWATRRQRKDDTSQIVLGRLFAKEVWLFLNSWTCIVAAVVLLSGVGQHLVAASILAHDRSRRDELSVACSDSDVTLTNNTDRTGLVEIRSAEILKTTQDNYLERGPDGERIYLPNQEHRIDLSHRRVELHAGQSEAIAYTLATAGPHDSRQRLNHDTFQDIVLTVEGDIGAERYDCSLRPPSPSPGRFGGVLFMPPGITPEDLAP